MCTDLPWMGKPGSKSRRSSQGTSDHCRSGRRWAPATAAIAEVALTEELAAVEVVALAEELAEVAATSACRSRTLRACAAPAANKDLVLPKAAELIPDDKLPTPEPDDEDAVPEPLAVSGAVATGAGGGGG